jgi:flagellar hook-associated protein 1 FlgK
MITVNNILDIADSAMTANTAAMNTVSQNVANVNTPFYNSETPIENEAPAVVGAPYTYGTGVNVDQIQRSTDNFVQSEVNNETGQNSYYTTLYQGLDQIQNLFNDQTGSGFSSQISQFFNDFQNVANNPSNTSQRTALLSDAQSLAGSINNAYTTIQNTVASTNNSIQGLIPEINNLTTQIAGLNKQITYAINAGSNANELQDEQANAINSLSKLVNISYYTNNNGKTNIALGNVPLVSSDDSFKLSTQVDPSNPENLDIMWTGPDGSAQSVTSQVTGGTLGAYVNLEQNVAPSYLNQLNSLAAAVTDNVNSLQYNGYGLDGSTGNYFFQPDLTTAVGKGVNDATISTGMVTNPADLTGDSYTITANTTASSKTTFSVYNNTTKTTLSPSAVSSSTPTVNSYGQSVYTIGFDGVSVNITSTATTATSSTPVALTNDDTFTVNQMTTDPAFTMAVNPNLTTSQVAAASAVSTAVNPSNTGDATISAGAVINPTDVTNGTTITNSNEGGQYTIKYMGAGTTGTGDFTVTNNTTNLTQTINNIPITTNSSGQSEYSIFFGNQNFNGSNGGQAENFHVTLTGTPQIGDSFTANVLSPSSSPSVSNGSNLNSNYLTPMTLSNMNSAGLSGNNENALALGALQNNNLPINSTSSTISTYYSNIVSNIGTQAQNANTNYTNSTSVLTNLQNQLQSFVGVNMNQQMTNLVNYQNSYQAAAAITSSVEAIMTALLATVP